MHLLYGGSSLELLDSCNSESFFWQRGCSFRIELQMGEVMKPLNRFNLVSLCAFALTTACGTETPNRLATPATPLEGQWIKKCEANDGQSSVETLSVTGDRVDRRATVFWGETCSPGSEFFLARLSARQKIGARMSSDRSLTELDIYDMNKFIRVFDDATALEMNKINRDVPNFSPKQV